MNRSPSTLYTITFVTLTALVSGVLLMGANHLLGSRIETNLLNDRYRSLFALAGVDVSGRGASDLKRLYSLRFAEERTRRGGARLRFSSTAQTITYIYPFSGMGFWGPIHGYIALDQTLSVIRGVVFTRQEETPGLGAEIVTEAFTKRFSGLKFTRDAASEKVLMKITKAGEATGPYEIDGITGATETTVRVNAMIGKTLKAAVSDRRGGRHGS